MYTPLNWTTTQRHVAFACFTSWMLDAFDFFILVFVLSDLAEWFHASVSTERVPSPQYIPYVNIPATV